MSNVLSNSPDRTASLLHKPRILNGTLWTIQGLLALLFLFVGSIKLILPLDALQAQMIIPLPGLFIRFIGGIEVAGALGLILPKLTRIKPWLTPLTACGLALEMIGATGYTLLGGGGALALFPMMVGLLAGVLAFGRRSWAQA